MSSKHAHIFFMKIFGMFTSVVPTNIVNLLLNTSAALCDLVSNIFGSNCTHVSPLEPCVTFELCKPMSCANLFADATNPVFYTCLQQKRAVASHQ